MKKMKPSVITAAVLAMGCSVAVAQRGVEQRTQVEGNQPQAARHQADSHSQQHLVKFFAGKLMLMNESTIAMSELAQKQAATQEVKDFAGMLAEGHTKLNQELEQLAPEVAALANLEATQRRTAGFRGNADNAARNDARQTDRRIAKRGQAADEVHSSKSADSTVQEILKIEQKAAQNYIHASTRMLERYQGQDFDMGFLGFQIGAHTWALSELKAMDSVGDEQFQQLVSDATQKIEHHLEQARQLAQKFEDKESAGSRN